MDRSSHDRRSFRDGDFQPMTNRLLDNAPAYDARARPDDGLCANETSRVPALQPGAASLLHARWQEEGSLDRLSRDECEALARAGYRIRHDEDGHWVWWRERRITHMWLHVNESGWATTSAPSLQGAKWKLIGSFARPTVPYFDGYAVDLQSLLREGLTTAVMLLLDYVPSRVINEQFFSVTRELCDEAAQNMEIETSWLSQVVFSGTLANGSRNT